MWSPSEHLHQRHPDVRVVEDRELPGGLQGCVDHEERIIWLDVRLSPVARRSTLAFEIGQLQQGPTPLDPRLAAAHRLAAADWAARMLIHIDDLVDSFACCDGYAAVAERLGVDVPTVRTRLRGLTDAEQDGVLEAIYRLRLTA